MNNQTTPFITQGMSKSKNAKSKKREINDYYATDPIAIDCLLSYGPLKEELSNLIWECACGEGHLSERLADYGYTVHSTDLINRDYGDAFFDFLEFESDRSYFLYNCNIITNPPFKLFDKFMKKGLDLITKGKYLILLGKLSIQEGQKRGKFYKENPPKYVLVFSKRLTCAINGDFDNYSDGMQAYAWYVFEKGFKGKTLLDWVNNNE